jgi:polar amino acid transport system substrate-binding protein
MTAPSLLSRPLALAAVSALSLTLIAGCGGSAQSSGAASGDGAEFLTPGTLTVCGSLTGPPNIFAEADGTAVGAEVDIAKAMVKQMGVKLDIKNYAFSGLIPALQARQCDVIMSSLYIKPEREKVVDFVPYLRSGSGVAVAAANPKGVTGLDDSLCGVNAVGITGATGAALLEEQSTTCTQAGKPAVKITLTDRPAEALQQVIAGQLDAFVDTAEIVNYYEKQSDGKFVPVGDQVGVIDIGAATLKDNAKLNGALQTAFDAVVADGTYPKILDTWGLQAQNITTS